MVRTWSEPGSPDPLLTVIEPSIEPSSAAPKNGEAFTEQSRGRVGTQPPKAPLVDVDGVLLLSQEPSRKKRKPSLVFSLPDWVPREQWDAFVEMRRAKRAPTTDYAARYLVARLDRMRDAGQDVAAILNQSTVSGWKNVYEIKGGPHGNRNKADQRQQHNLAACERVKSLFKTKLA